MISALVHTRNEREQLPGCLESLRWADEIVVADMASEDGTREIATKFGARLIDVPVSPIVEPARNLAIAQCRGDWVFILDADERASPGLISKIPEWTRATDVAAYFVPRRNYFLGVWLEHGNWPDSQVRLFRKGKTRWSDLVHEHPEVDGKCVRLPENPLEAIEHPGYVTNVGRFMAKLLHYAQLDAERLDTKIAPAIWPWILRRPLNEFYGRYIKEQAWRHGMHGLVWSALMAIYQFQMAVHCWDRRGEKTQEEPSALRRKARVEVWRAASKWLR